MTDSVLLAGCQPEPLGSYLKGLGVLRLAGEQLDPGVRGAWEPGGLALLGIGRDALLGFVMERYRPTPLVAPWNGGSGFGPKDQRAGIDAIEQSSSQRLAGYRQTIAIARDLYALGLDKAGLIEACRARLPDEAVAWLDAAVVLVDGDVRYPPVLGTGGNLGRLELSNNFMQRLADVLCLRSGRGAPTPALSRQWLEAALLAEREAPRQAGSIGQFDPGATGGVNSSPLGAAESLVNPWELVLLLEGALLFASAAARRMAGPRAAGLPFMVTASPVGYVTGTAGESLKGELWAPLWERPATAREVANLFGEGRAQWRGRQARSGLDLARAATSLGVDRGVGTFVRHVFAERLGQSPLAVPSGRVRVMERPEVPVLGQLDDWLAGLRGQGGVPAAVASAVRRVDAAMMAVALHGDVRHLQDVLVAVAEAEVALGNAGVFRQRSGRQPVNGLLAWDWLPRLDDGSAELRLAAALASQHEWVIEQRQRRLASPRTLLRPVAINHRGRATWSERPARAAGLGHVDLPRVLAAALHQRGLEVQAGAARTGGAAEPEGIGPAPAMPPVAELAAGSSPVGGPTAAVPSAVTPAAGVPVPVEPSTGADGVPTAYRNRLWAPVEDVMLFAAGELDEPRLERLLLGMLLLDWRSASRPSWMRGNESWPRPAREAPMRVGSPPPSPALALLAPFFYGAPLPAGPDKAPVLLEPAASWPAQLAAGQVEAVATAALRRLRVARVQPLLRTPRLIARHADGPRLAAAMLCPISKHAALRLLGRVAVLTTLLEEQDANSHEQAPAPV